MARSTTGNQSQFTYDFGISIAQSTVNKMIRLTGATVTLASAMYALQNTADKYVKTLRENALRFGGYLSTIRAMEEAQNRLIKGQTSFSVDDQLRGMNRLASVGIKVGKDFDFINKAAHATGKNFAEFSGAIASAIQGNMSSLVDMGLLTQRATRMFDKYQANTIMRQQAILNFVKQHKGLMNLIKNDFMTIQDQTSRLKQTWKGFLTSIIGKPNDPGSLYGSVVKSLKGIADAFSRNFKSIQQYGKGIGTVLSWVVRQIGNTVVWLGRKAKAVTQTLLGSSENFVNRMRSLVVWLEFWKLKILDFFNAYKEEIKFALKLLLAFKALKMVFAIGNFAIGTVTRYGAALSGVLGTARKLKGVISGIFGMLGTKLPWVRRAISWMSGSRGLGLVVSLLNNAKAIFSGIGGYLSGTLIGRVASLAGTFGLVYATLKSVHDALKWIGNYVPGIGDWIKRADNAISDSVQSYKRMYYDVSLAVRTYWSDFKNWYTKNISDPIIAKWKNDGMPQFFERLKNSILDFGRKIQTALLEPFRRTFGPIIDFLKNRYATYKQTKMVSDMREKLHKSQSDYLEVLAINATKQRYKAAGLPVPDLKYPTRVQELLDQRNGTVPIGTEATNAKKGATTGGIGNILKGNPMLLTPKAPEEDITSSYSDGSLTLDTGAVQIIVQKGENIDETKLAREVRRILKDLQRETNVRGGK